MNNMTLQKLNYYELKEKLKGYCISGLGKDIIDKIEPSTNIKEVKRRLNETSEGRRLIDASYHIPLEGVFNIKNLIDKIEKGAALEPEDLTIMSNFFRGCRKLKIFMDSKESYAPTLKSYADSISDLKYIEDEINISISGSRVDSNASKELKKIRKQIDICEGRIKEKLEKFLKSSANKEYIQDFFVSKRNGRYTIPIKAAYKNNVMGVIVDTSAKGGTVFVEPNSVGKYTTELASLEAEESVEEYKILSLLTEMINERMRDIKINIDVIAQFDMVYAKSKYSREIDGIEPLVNDHGYIKIVKGHYPLMEKPVPLDFEIGKCYRTLIITGPNAGGKTVVLKTVGILTIATMLGLHIKAEKDTNISVFKKIFVDIGDDQSIENALSTFSSHVKNLSNIIHESNKSTLLLFDEIGSGTEPNEGASLAIAILQELYKMGCITVATTHYGEIKNYSKEHPDFENAAMEFERETLEPKYKLKIGISGDSNALYIAKKMGIPDSIIKNTRYYIENKNYDYDLVNESKVRKEKIEENNNEKRIDFSIGDKVLYLDKNESAIIYKGIDEYNNVTIFIDKTFLEVNYKRVKLELKASELYPEGYDMNQIFVSYKDRKLEKDIKRGSKRVVKEARRGMTIESE